VNYGQPNGGQQPGANYGQSGQAAGYPGPGFGQGPAGRGVPAQAAPQPVGGKALLGPLTLRDVLVLVSVVLLLIGSGVGNFGRLGFIVNLEFLGLGLLLPLAVGVGFVIRRVSPGTKLRLGSFSLDQLASVLASLSLLSAVSQLGVLPFLGYYGYINWTSVILGFLGAVLLFVTTVLARFIPVFAADFTGRPEVPAHVVARDAAQATRSVQSAYAGAPAQQYPSTPGYGAPQGGPAPYAPQGYQPQTGQQNSGWVAPATIPSGPLPGEASGAPETGHPDAQQQTSGQGPAQEHTQSAAPGSTAPAASTPTVAEAGTPAAGDQTAQASETADAQDGNSSSSLGSSSAVLAADDQGPVDPAPGSGGVGEAHSVEEPAPKASDAEADGADTPALSGQDAEATTARDEGDQPVDDLLKDAETHVAEAPELPEPVLGVPELNEPVEEPEEEEAFAPHPDDDSDVTVLRSALNTGASRSGSHAAEASLAEEASPAAERSSEPIHAVVDPHREAEQPVQQAFWFAVPERRVALDERSGSPVFDLLPGKWILALQEGPQGLVVQNEDGRIGVLHDLRNIERGS